eukprot:scaffold356259_cov96-Cyclotella_meneghiniana.AAC.1
MPESNLRRREPLSHVATSCEAQDIIPNGVSASKTRQQDRMLICGRQEIDVLVVPEGSKEQSTLIQCGLHATVSNNVL